LSCLLDGKVQSAATTRTGTALCEDHATVDGGVVGIETRCRTCEEEGMNHQAWTMRVGQPICIFHAIDDAFLGDDMREHDLFVLIYEELRKMGRPEAF
jgi:hypothetical protein